MISFTNEENKAPQASQKVLIEEKDKQLFDDVTVAREAEIVETFKRPAKTLAFDEGRRSRNVSGFFFAACVGGEDQPQVQQKFISEVKLPEKLDEQKQEFITERELSTKQSINAQGVFSGGIYLRFNESISAGFRGGIVLSPEPSKESVTKFEALKKDGIFNFFAGLEAKLEDLLGFKDVVGTLFVGCQGIGDAKADLEDFEVKYVKNGFANFKDEKDKVVKRSLIGKGGNLLYVTAFVGKRGFIFNDRNVAFGLEVAGLTGSEEISDAVKGTAMEDDSKKITLKEETTVSRPGRISVSLASRVFLG